MRYISAERLHRAIVNLKSWGDDVGQLRAHSYIFLSSKLMDMKAKTPIELRDSDERKFWNSFMRLRGDSKPFFDPMTQSYKADNFPHNSAFKVRSDRWPTPDYGIAIRDGNLWTFTDDYVARLRDKTLTDGAEIHLYPEPDLIAWLYRSQRFENEETYSDLQSRFREQFHLTEPELSSLFSETSNDGEGEADSDFFTDRLVREDLLIEIAKSSSDTFDLADAIEVVTERSGPQPVELADVKDLAMNGRRQIIFQGPPGTGKTFLARQATAMILGAEEDVVADPTALDLFLIPFQAPADGSSPDGAPGIWDIVQFHPSYNYEDFVRGIGSEIDGGHPVFKAENRTIAALAKTASEIEKPVVLIIDEINRGDLAKVLGELIFALEYRGVKVRTPYTVDGSPLISLPKNLFLLATMNTADRSIALIDYAIRRRFDFVDVPSSRDSLEQFLDKAESESGFTQHVLSIYDAVNELLLGDPDHQVGHTYFMSTTKSEIARRVVFQVLPLLAEYQREGLVVENVRVKPSDWPNSRGIPLIHPRPFDLVAQIEEWL